MLPFIWMRLVVWRTIIARVSHGRSLLLILVKSVRQEWKLGRVRDYLSDSSFCFTYGDGVVDVNISALLDHQTFRSSGHAYGGTASGRYGALHLDGDVVNKFQEKPDGDNAWINGGFFVVEPSVLHRINGDLTSWEADVLPQLAADSQLSAYRHKGFWQPMDTLRDRNRLEELWANDEAPWKIW